jgi:hypothetical protein
MDEHFDATVAENGAVLSRGAARERTLAEPGSSELARALELRGISVQQGRVLLALSAEHASAAELEIERLGLEYHLVRNRAALMILPPAVSRGAGLCEALAELGISPHSTLAVGDAENDHSLIDVCELGVAVGNAVDALKAHADVVLREANGAGVRAFLDGPILSGAVRVHPRRWDVTLGTFEGGEAATIPASQAKLLVTGDSGSEKSYVAGLLAERLISLGYTVCVVDPEGEHDALDGCAESICHRCRRGSRLSTSPRLSRRSDASAARRACHTGSSWTRRSCRSGLEWRRPSTSRRAASAS